jgi:hypothetical protein
MHVYFLGYSSSDGGWEESAASNQAPWLRFMDKKSTAPADIEPPT